MFTVMSWLIYFLAWSCFDNDVGHNCDRTTRFKMLFLIKLAQWDGSAGNSLILKSVETP